MAVDHLKAGPVAFMPLYFLQHLLEGLSIRAAAHWVQMGQVVPGIPCLLDWTSSALAAFCSVAPGASSLGSSVQSELGMDLGVGLSLDENSVKVLPQQHLPSWGVCVYVCGGEGW